MSSLSKNIIAVGASAGGIESVSQFLSTIPEKLNAAVFVVIHLPADSQIHILLTQLQKHSKLNCKIPFNGEKITNNTLYLAPADHHMMLDSGTILVSKGAKENHYRPSIDVLFRSAAASFDSCVTGVILSGLLDDGTSGMIAIKESGGLCIVQEPSEAFFPDMPQNVLRNVDVDYKVSISEMGYIIADMFERVGECNINEVPSHVKLEAEITRRLSSDYNEMKNLGTATTFTCPDCGGVLTKIEEQHLVRYRCYTGHSFTENVLEKEQLNSLEESLWVAIRMLEERKNLLMNMAKQPENNRLKQDKLERSTEIEEHVRRLKEFLQNIHGNG